MERELTCIGCPMGCNLSVHLDNDELYVKGNACKRGVIYAREEIFHPSRIVTSTMRVLNGTRPVVPVKTLSPIPKDKIFDCIQAMKSLTLEAPITYHQVLMEDVVGTGVNVVSVKQVEKVNKEQS